MAAVATVPEIAAHFSILTPVYNAPLGPLLACAAGVRAQTLGDWEWCVVDDCSTRPEVLAELTALAASDPRIRFRHRDRNGGIVASSNDTLAMATGEFVAFLDHDDALVPTALADVAAMLDTDAGATIDYLYTDEAHVLVDGRETAHFLKPHWSPERFRSSMYTCHLSVLRRSVVTAIGGFRPGFDGSQDHDLILRATEQITAAGRHVAHLPRLTYHWRNVSSSMSRASDTLDTAIQRGRQAVQEQCDRLGIDAQVVHGGVEGCYRLVRVLPAQLAVTVVVATAGEMAPSRPYRLAAAATMTSLASTFAGARLVVAYPEDLPASIVELLTEAAGWDAGGSDAGVAEAGGGGGEGGGGVAGRCGGGSGSGSWQPVPVPGPWSVAVALDRAVQAYPGDVLVSIAPGLAPRSDLTPDWLETLAALALQPGVGLAGGLVASAEDVVVHAGWDVPNYRWYELEGLRVGTTSSGNDLFIERECSQVTLGAAAISVPHWHELKHTAAAAGSWDAAGRALSDALTATGLSTLWTPFARFDQVVPLT